MVYINQFFTRVYKKLDHIILIVNFKKVIFTHTYQKTEQIRILKMFLFFFHYLKTFRNKSFQVHEIILKKAKSVPLVK